MTHAHTKAITDFRVGDMVTVRSNQGYYYGGVLKVGDMVTERAHRVHAVVTAQHLGPKGWLPLFASGNEDWEASLSKLPHAPVVTAP